MPNYTHRPGPKPAAYQQADGTKLRLQASGHNAGSADLRLVVGSRTPHGPLEVLDYSLAETWEELTERLHQRCLAHGRRNLPFALYEDGYLKANRGRIERALARIPGLQLCQAELARLDPTDPATLRELLEASEQALLVLKRPLPAADFPHTRAYVLGLIEEGLAYLRHLFATGQTIRFRQTGRRASGAGCSSASSRSTGGGPLPGR